MNLVVSDIIHQMNYILLTGAGFSRNWGGWLASEAFEYLLGCQEILGNQYLQDRLWRNLPTGGFENALAEVQANFKKNPQSNTQNLLDMQRAVTKMFNDMNRGYFDNNVFEFQHAIERMVKTFLTKFDAIFTLNQDLLLEHYYINHDVSLISNNKWVGSELPGMQPIPNANVSNQDVWAKSKWMPDISGNFQLNSRFQPYFKLHGSSNWQEKSEQPMLIMGGNKIRDINLHPVLRWYYEQFEGRLSAPNTRLMIIGYGFRDEHINTVIMNAVNQYGLKMFIVAPEGGDLARKINPTNAAAIRVPTAIEETFEHGLIGASRRSLSETFGSDTIEFNKVMRFFEA